MGAANQYEDGVVCMIYSCIKSAETRRKTSCLRLSQTLCETSNVEHHIGGFTYGQKNRTPKENARREKIRELLQMANIRSMM